MQQHRNTLMYSCIYIVRMLDSTKFFSAGYKIKVKLWNIKNAKCLRIFILNTFNFITTLLIKD